jgi:hypothetical protein
MHTSRSGADRECQGRTGVRGLSVETPPILYKYLPPERLDILVNGKIRITQPTSTNDPFDLLPFVQPLADHDIPSNMATYLADNPPLETPRSELPPSRPTTVAAELSQRFKAVTVKVFKSVGIISLTATPSSLPVWAHYADNHRGFVIGFKIPSSDFLIGPIDYTAERPTFRTELDTNGSIRTDGDPMKVLLAKSREWEYEKEWRILVPMDDRKPASTLNGDLLIYRI